MQVVTAVVAAKQQLADGLWCSELVELLWDWVIVNSIIAVRIRLIRVPYETSMLRKRAVPSSRDDAMGARLAPQDLHSLLLPLCLSLVAQCLPEHAVLPGGYGSPRSMLH